MAWLEMVGSKEAQETFNVFGSNSLLWTSGFLQEKDHRAVVFPGRQIHAQLASSIARKVSVEVPFADFLDLLAGGRFRQFGVKHPAISGKGAARSVNGGHRLLGKRRNESMDFTGQSQVMSCTYRMNDSRADPLDHLEAWQQIVIRPCDRIEESQSLVFLQIFQRQVGQNFTDDAEAARTRIADNRPAALVAPAPDA